MRRKSPPETGRISATSSRAQAPHRRPRSAVDGVEQADRLLAEPERGPDVRDPRPVGEVELAGAGAGALAQAGEEADAHLHRASVAALASPPASCYVSRMAVRMQPRTNLNDQVYETLKQRLVRRELGPGEKVSLHALAESLGVSRSPSITR